MKSLLNCSPSVTIKKLDNETSESQCGITEKLLLFLAFSGKLNLQNL